MKHNYALPIARCKLTTKALALVVTFCGMTFTPLAIGLPMFDEERNDQANLSSNNRVNDRVDEMDTGSQIQRGTLSLQGAPIESSEEATAGGAPQSPQGNLDGVRIENITPDLTAHQEEISTADHLMQLIGNPVRTLLAISENTSCCTDTSIAALSVLNPNNVITSHRNLMEVRDQLRSMEFSLLRFRNQTLPEYRTCMDSFNHAEEAFDHALQLFHNKNTPWSEYTDAITSAANAFRNFATSVKNLGTAQTAATASMPPGAYRISAEEAANEGSFPYHDHLPAREPAEAISVNLPIGHLQPLPEKDPALRLLRKAPYRPDSLPIVQAEAPIMMVHEIPVAEASIVPQEH